MQGHPRSAPVSNTRLSVAEMTAQAHLDQPRLVHRYHRAIIVESNEIHAVDLAGKLRWLGLEVVIVTRGEDALAHCSDASQAVFFVNIDLPDMDGFETTRQLKRLSEDRFTPVILLTPPDPNLCLKRCADAGVDDFLSTPVSTQILQARLLVMNRICALQASMSERKVLLSGMIEREHMTHALAERVLSRAVEERNVVMDRLGIVQRSATIFSGDILLTQHLPDGGLRILMGDFTGHGLAAAVGALPVADAFHAMTRKGASDGLVLAELNRKLYHLLPADRFMAACLITLSADGKTLRWWNGGMPSGWLKTLDGLLELQAHSVSLGILPELPGHGTPRQIALAPDDRLLLMTDGLLEAEDAQGCMFMDTRLATLLHDWRHAESILPALRTALDIHSTGVSQSDDISVLEVPLHQALFGVSANDQDPYALNGWTINLTLEDERLRVQPILELLLEPLGRASGLQGRIEILQTILTELYANALEHGVFELDSSIKTNHNGFDTYYRELARCLEDRCSGWIAIRIVYESSAYGGCVRIRVSDSGKGFNESDISTLSLDSTRPWGRGIQLLRQLCESVVFDRNGSRVEVLYRW